MQLSRHLTVNNSIGSAIPGLELKRRPANLLCLCVSGTINSSSSRSSSSFVLSVGRAGEV